MGRQIRLIPAESQVQAAASIPASVLPLGSRAAIIAALQKHLPGILLNEEESFGEYDSGEYWVEFYLGQSDPIPFISLEIHGSGPVTERLRALCRESGWELYDVARGEHLTFDDPLLGTELLL